MSNFHEIARMSEEFEIIALKFYRVRDSGRHKLKCKN